MGGCHQSVAAPRLHQFHGGSEPLEARIATGGVALTKLHRFAEGLIDHLQLRWIGECLDAAPLEALVAGFQPAPATHEQGGRIAPWALGDGLQGDLSPDTGRIAEGNG